MVSLTIKCIFPTAAMSSSAAEGERQQWGLQNDIHVVDDSTSTMQPTIPTSRLWQRLRYLRTTRPMTSSVKSKILMEILMPTKRITAIAMPILSNWQG